MTKKALQMKELMGRLGNLDPKPRRPLQRRSLEDCYQPLPVEVLVDAKQDRIHEEKRSSRRIEPNKIKRIRLKKND